MRGMFVAMMVTACAVPDAVFDNPLDPVNLGRGPGATDSGVDTTTVGGTSVCATNNGGCSPDASCTASGGGRTCTCMSGYTGDGVTCTVVAANPCATNNGGCSVNATCAVSGSGRTCACKQGFTGDGVTCTVVSTAIAGDLVTKTFAGQTFEFSYIEAGTFQMGTSGSGSDENPQHSVTLTKAFLLQRTETTQAQYQAVVGSNPSAFPGDGQRPVEWVSWYDAVAFCDRLSQLEGVTQGTYGLPTEAQWEYAARAGTTGSTYGNLADIAWYSDNSGSVTHAVKGKQANAWNLYDMLGNVWEWTADWYGNYPQSAVTDPTGPASGSTRVDRGGSWDNGASRVRASRRYDDTPGSTGNNLGFRPLRSLP